MKSKFILIIIKYKNKLKMDRTFLILYKNGVIKMFHKWKQESSVQRPERENEK